MLKVVRNAAVQLELLNCQMPMSMTAVVGQRQMDLKLPNVAVMDSGNWTCNNSNCRCP